MKRYNELKEAGRIAFTTFHQSYGCLLYTSIVFVTDGGVICKVISDGKDKPVMIEEDKVKDENL